MKSLRSKIVKVGILNLLLLGLLAAVAKPLDGSVSGQNFRNWLQVLVKKTQNEDAKQQIRTLQASNSDLAKIVNQASKIVSEHAADFDLPATKSSWTIQQLLLVEWNQYQSGSTMLAVPAANTIKSLTGHQSVSNFLGSAAHGLILSNTEPIESRSIVIEAFQRCSKRIIQPLINGIAIGAP